MTLCTEEVREVPAVELEDIVMEIEEGETIVAGIVLDILDKVSNHRIKHFLKKNLG